jgi:hypothetical protein
MPEYLHLGYRLIAPEETDGLLPTWRCILDLNRAVCDEKTQILGFSALE